MKQLQQISEKGNLAVRRLRLSKFEAGQPFMIYSRELPKNQIYLEFSNGLIQLAQVDSSKRDFQVIRNLTQFEAKTLRVKYKLA